MVKNGLEHNKLFDKTWANEKLRSFIKVLKQDIGRSKPQHMVILARQVEEDLRSAGFWWQADRVKNHLHVYLRSCRGRGSSRKESGLDRVLRGEVGDS